MNRLFARRTRMRLSIAAALIAGCAVAFSMTNDKQENGARKITLSYLTTIADANAETHCDVAVPQLCGGDGSMCTYEVTNPYVGYIWVTSTVCRP